MSSRGAGAAALMLGVLLPSLVRAQGPVIVEWGAHATAVVVDSMRFGVVVGPRMGLRTFGGTRVVASIGAGVLADSGVVRAEAAVEYEPSPRTAGKTTFYFGGGLAGVTGARRGGYLLLYVGLEKSPGLPAGWAVEAGLGGGFRFRVAYHWRRFPRGWQAVR